jgi:4,5:9,10-diseco-3-hydroxy-5,9,17-trioxoandrosta-1(10),2-diene-4-oate hydrolase
VSARRITLRSGLHLRVVEAGAPGAPPVVMLPGWGCSAYLYRKNLPALAAAGAHAIAVELPGQGWSDHSESAGAWTLEARSTHALDALDALALDRVMLVGLSLGGGIAARVALRAPDRVDRLALLDAVGLGPVGVVELTRLVPDAAARLAEPFTGRWVFAAALRFAYGRLATFSARDVDEYFAPTRDPAFVRSLWRQLHETDWRLLTTAEMRRLVMPMVAMFGTRDIVVRPTAVQRLVAAAAHGRVVLVPEAGHALAEEAPDAVNRELVSLLRA